MKTISSEEFGTIASEADLEALNRQQLTRLYNELTGETKKPATTKAACVERVVAAIATVQTSEDAAKAEPEPAPGPKPKATKKPKAGAKTPAKKAKSAKVETPPARRIPVDLAPDPDGVKQVRPDTKRAATLALLKGSPKGATIEDVMEATGWDRRTAMDGIRLLNSYVGYGLKEDAQGRIRAIKS